MSFENFFGIIISSFNNFLNLISNFFTSIINNNFIKLIIFIVIFTFVISFLFKIINTIFNITSVKKPEGKNKVKNNSDIE